MNKNVVITLLCIFLGWHQAQAQELNLLAPRANGSIEKTNADYLNVAKINLSSLPLRNFAFQYERRLIPHIAVGLGYRFMPNGKIPLLNTVTSSIKDFIDVDDTDNEIESVLNAAKIKGSVWTLDARFYVNKKMKGFYVAAFGRVENYKLTSIFPYELDGNRNNANIQAKFSNTGIGLMIGTQFSLGKRVTLDWWILGPYIGNSKIDILVNNYEISDADMAKFEDQFGELVIENDYFKSSAKVGKTESSAVITGNMPGLRGMGINIGFRF